MGRGDHRGATRLALFILIVWWLCWIFIEHHIPSIGELYLLFFSTAHGLMYCLWIWFLYIAFEPFVRRRWPSIMIGWSRLLAGKYHDPVIGRDLLVGCVAAVVISLWLSIIKFLPEISVSLPPESSALWDLLSGSHMIVAWYLRFVTISILWGLGIAFIIFILKVLFRRTWAVAAVPTVLIGFIIFLSTSSIAMAISIAIVIGAFLYLFFRFGLLAISASFLFFIIFTEFPITTRLSDWYFKIGLTGVVLLLVFVVYAFYTSLGGRPMFGTPRLDE
ncbi:MAG: hypothetical protein P8Z37_17340 [Acidobacteriota bacterium]